MFVGVVIGGPEEAVPVLTLPWPGGPVLAGLHVVCFWVVVWIF